MINGSREKAWALAGALGGAVTIAAGFLASHGRTPLAMVGLQTQSAHIAIYSLAIFVAVSLAIDRRPGERRRAAKKTLLLAAAVLFPDAVLALTVEAPRWVAALTSLGCCG